MNLKHWHQGDTDTYIAKPQNFDNLKNVVLFIHIIKTGNYSKDWEKEAGNYHISIGCITPDTTDPIGIIQPENIAYWQSTSLETKAVWLIGETCTPIFWQQTGNNHKLLLKEARKNLTVILADFINYMDKPQNKIGATGWDVLKGDFLGSSKDLTMKQIVEKSVKNSENLT